MKQSRNTKQRRLVAAAVKARRDHPTADRIYMDVREKNSKISRGTVYRNLNMLSETGEINHVRVPFADRYDLRTTPHYHLFCTSCKTVVDAPLEYAEEYDRQIEKSTGFKIKRHCTIFEGLCPECRYREENKDKNL